MRRLLSLGYSALASNFRPLTKPYKLNYAVTLSCQSQCRTCNIWSLRPKGELDIGEIREFAKKNSYFKWIALTGGEPFLRSDIVDIVQAFSESCRSLYLLTVPTNSLCNADKVLGRISQIAELKVPRIAITLSLDGYRELHDSIRGIPGNYDRVMTLYKGLRELKEKHRGISTFFGYTISRFNEGNLIKTVERVGKELPGVKYSDFHINLAQTSDNYYRNGGAAITCRKDIATSEIEEIMKRTKPSLDPMHVLEGAFMSGLLEFVRTDRQPCKSMSLNASLFMDSVGSIYPSIMWDRKLGNIRNINYDLSGIWHSAQAEEIRQSISEGKEPRQWTSCEAYQSLAAHALNML
ncbi:MAG: radical SAM protein [Candidatus Marsarchaeota archaeon]|nr:radical SAM protein [Candidatus Marsarchaeota archaeon]MCL5413010.1 radical SAM protein [Candidatus Marsarchaeota archaeon]